MRRGMWYNVPHMTLQQLKYADQVAAVGSISEAARKLFVTQPTLTEAVRTLEEELRMAIFNRSAKGVTVIYKAIEDMELAMKGMLEPEYREVLLGHAEVRNVFKITGAGIIAGCYVQDGKIQRNASVRVLRDNIVVFEGQLASLRRFKDDVKEVAEGYECGISIERFNDLKEGDILEAFVMEQI